MNLNFKNCAKQVVNKKSKLSYLKEEYFENHSSGLEPVKKILGCLGKFIIRL